MAFALVKRLVRWRPGRLASNTLASTGWQMMRLGLQVLSLVLVARLLGPEGYGTFAGFGSVAVILGNLTGWGSSYLLLQSVSRAPATFGRHWYATQHIILISSTLLTLLYLTITPSLLQLSLPFLPLLAIALSELLCYPLVYAAGFAFQAHERMAWASALPAGMALARLAGASLFWLAGGKTLESYADYHLTTSIVAMMAALLAVQWQLSPKPERQPYTWKEMQQGLRFSSGTLSTSLLSEMDKILAVRYLGPEPGGAYSIAYRLLGTLATPVLSLMMASQPRLFRHNSTKGNQLQRLLLILLIVILSYTSIAALVVWFAAPWLTLLLGADYVIAIEATSMLTPLLPLLSLRLAASLALTSLGHPSLRSGMELVALVILGFGLSWALPRHGLPGGVAILISTESLLLLGLLLAVAYITAGKSRNPACYGP